MWVHPPALPLQCNQLELELVDQRHLVLQLILRRATEQAWSVFLLLHLIQQVLEGGGVWQGLKAVGAPPKPQQPPLPPRHVLSATSEVGLPCTYPSPHCIASTWGITTSDGPCLPMPSAASCSGAPWACPMGHPHGASQLCHGSLRWVWPL